MEVIAQKISKKSLFKLLTIGFTLGIGALCIVFGIFAFFGAETVEWNGTYKTGLEGLLYSFLIGPILGFFSACFIWCFTAFGLWVFSLFRPIKLSFKKPINEQEIV